MNPIRVFLVDDSAVVRRLVADALAGDPGVAVVGSAPDGKAALARLPQVRPDLVVLDVEMPEMDGLQTLAALRKTDPRLPVVMFSTETRRGAAATLDALALGASDYLTKPVTAGGVAQAVEYIRAELLPKIKALCPAPPGGRSGVSPGSRSSAPPPPEPVGGRVPPASAAAPCPVPLRPQPFPPARPAEVVVIGVSTGGPAALADLLPALPASLPVPVLVVLHMPPVFTRLLAERLTATNPVPVAEAVDGEAVRPGRVYLAPGGYHMAVTRDAGPRVVLTQDPPENFCRPAVDVLFRAAATAYGPATLAVVLTGMGQDGRLGCEAVRAAGGQVVVQDQATSVVWGMPGAVVRAGLADEVLPLNQLAAAVTRRTRSGRSPVPAAVTG
jgi:two-component system chemotaxis response regulator CheB